MFTGIVEEVGTILAIEERILGDIADVRLETGAAYIYRENSSRFVPIKYSVRGRDLGSTVEEAMNKVRELQ